jgi:hypothetical protein
MTNRVNFTERQDEGGWAKYLPAISGFYTTHLGKDLEDENFVPFARLPKKFEYGLQGLNFLDPEYSYFNYKYALYSAGHAERNLEKCDKKEPMIHKRDRSNTVIVGDSGGFQIATGVIKLDWATVKTPASDKLRNEILRYLEYTADWSMTLDVPAFAALPPLNEKTGLTCFEDCLEVTDYNLKYFMENRIPGKTKFLNVLSGSSHENSKIWYEKVKQYSIPSEVKKLGYGVERTLEGWAFAGINVTKMQTVLERLLDLRRDGLLEGKDWIHFLGIGRLDWACYLTSIERQLKKYNPNINISFDASSPFVAAGGYALSYNYNKFNANQLTYAMGRGIDNKKLKGSTAGLPFQGPINDRLTLGDICVMGPDDLNKHGKKGKTSWDTTSYALVMAHNVYNHIQAIQEVNRLADADYAIRDKDSIKFSEWRSKSDKGIRLNTFIPNSIIYFNRFVELLFEMNDGDARDFLKAHETFLHEVSFNKNKHAVSTTHDSIFDVTKIDKSPKDYVPTAEDLVDIHGNLELVMDADSKTEKLKDLD